MIDFVGSLRGLPVRLLGDLVPTVEPRAGGGDGVELVSLEGRRSAGADANGEVDETAALGPLELSRRLPPEPAAVPEARDALEPLAPVVDPTAFSHLRLLVSELVSNSVRHGAPGSPVPIELSVVAARHRVRAEVVDSGPGFIPAAASDGEERASGWGLQLVERLSDRWGLERNGRTVVWFELEAELPSEWWLREASDGVATLRPRREAAAGRLARPDGGLLGLRSIWGFLDRRVEPEADVD